MSRVGGAPWPHDGLGEVLGEERYDRHGWMRELQEACYVVFVVSRR